MSLQRNLRPLFHALFEDSRSIFWAGTLGNHRVPETGIFWIKVWDGGGVGWGGVSATWELKFDFSKILGTLDWPPVGGQKFLGILAIKHKGNHARIVHSD